MGKDFVMTGQRLNALDGLKGLCCVPIVFIHYHSVANHWSIPASELPFYHLCRLFYEKGALFVYPFFWLSGFLMAMQYGNTLQDITVVSFLRKRMKRLYPMVFVSITLGVIISGIDWILIGVKMTPPLDLEWIALNYLLMHNSWFVQSDFTAYGSGTWFVCVLLLCYLYFYLIFRFIRKEYRIYACVLMFILGVSSMAIPVMWSPSGICAFFGGVILYELVYDQENQIVLHDICKPIKILFYSLCFVILIYIFIKIEDFSQERMLFFVSPVFILISIEVPFAKAILETRILQWLGRISVSIYLSHMHVQRIIGIVLKKCSSHLTFQQMEIWVIVFLSCIGMAILYYECVEKRFSKVFCRFVDCVLGQTNK